jgi:hypothetical protein
MGGGKSGSDDPVNSALPVLVAPALQCSFEHGPLATGSFKMESSKMNIQTKIATPLSRKAVLVAVNISQWTARKLDRKVTDEVNRSHNAVKDAGRYNKLLIEAERLAKINGLVSTARHLHYSMTRPWADEGPRILPNALYSKFTDSFRVIKRDFQIAADEFERDYSGFVEERKRSLNGLFNAKDYPDPSEIRSKFRLELTVLPFPDADDFRSNLDDDTVADIKREIAETSGNVIDNAMKHTASQIIDLVGHMAAKLHEYKSNKPGERKFFMDSLVDNVRDLAELLPAFNLTDDPKLTRITKRIAKELCAEDAKELRQNDAAREAVAKSADEIVAEVSKFLA